MHHRAAAGCALPCRQVTPGRTGGLP